MTTATGFIGRLNERRDGFGRSGLGRDEIARRVARLRFLARVLDTAVRLPNGFRFGADSLIGLMPGVGDAATTLIASYFVYEGYQLGLPPHALLAMAGNVAIGSVIGSVPLAGDLFDTVFKANVRNLRIIEKYLDMMEQPAPRRSF